MATLTLSSVRKSFGKRNVPVKDVSFEVASGEFLTLLGPSGCGKSTILRMIAGLEEPTSGTISLNGTDIGNLSPAERNVAMVFQSYALYPHMNVSANIEAGLRLRKVPQQERLRRIEEVSTLLGIGGLLSRKPASLSGGQRQRVALARALVRKPALYLLDEPLSNLDAQLRERVRAELKKIFEGHDAPVVYVTHDQTEAMTLSTRVALLNGGLIQQLASPREMYEKPANTFVAEFIGSPQISMFSLPVDQGKVSLGGSDIALPEQIAGWREVVLGVRPENVHLEGGLPGAIRLVGKVSLVEHLGASDLVALGLQDNSDKLRGLLPVGSAATGQSLELRVAYESLHWFCATSGSRLN